VHLGMWRRDRWKALSLFLAGVMAVLAVPVLLTTSSLRFAINAGGLYEYGFDQYDISRRTGIPRPDLSRVGTEIRDYFNNGTEFIDIRTTIYGQEQRLFTQRETLHMRDVKGLVRGVYLWQWVSLGYLLGYLVLYGIWLRKKALHLAAKRLLWGGAVTIVAIGAIGLGSLLGFDSLFLKFHQLGFSNDLWQLDPRVHNLIAMFPQDFFFDATIFVALMTMGQALLLVVAGGAYLWVRSRGEKSHETGEKGQALRERAT